MSRLGTLYHNKTKQPLTVAIPMAKRVYALAEHTQGHEPQVAMVHPSQKPEEKFIAGLKIYADKDVPLHHIRICSAEIMEVIND